MIRDSEASSSLSLRVFTVLSRVSICLEIEVIAVDVCKSCRPSSSARQHTYIHIF